MNHTILIIPISILFPYTYHNYFHFSTTWHRTWSGGSGPRWFPSTRWRIDSMGGSTECWSRWIIHHSFIILHYTFHHIHTVANFPSHLHYVNISSLVIKTKAMKLSSKVKTIKHVVKDDQADLSGKCIFVQNYNTFHHFSYCSQFFITFYITLTFLH